MRRTIAPVVAALSLVLAGPAHAHGNDASHGAATAEPPDGKPVATDGLRGNRRSRGPGVRTVGSVGGDRIGLHGVGA